ncbi:MAG TPA: sialidase family protein, partial [Aggregicoccus sp.]|nr:sialidase family protein [Aggregicoccus sp.]
MRRAHVAVLLLLLLAAGCSRPEAAGPSAELRLEPTARELTPSAGRDAQLLVRASGALLVSVVQKAAGGGAELMLYRSEDGGDTLSEPVRINSTPGEVQGHGESAPLLLAGAGMDVYAVWLARGAEGRRALRVARSGDFGRSFSPPVDAPVDAADAPSFFGAASGADGTLVVAWFGKGTAQQTLPGTSLLWVATSRDGGRSFGPALQAAANVCPCCRPVLAATPEGRWFLAWRNVAPGHLRDIVVAASDDGGQRWSAPVPVADERWRIDGCPHSGAALLVHAGALYAAWYSEVEGRAGLFWAKSPVGALAFGPRESLGGAIQDANHASLAVVGERVVAAFQGRAADEQEGWGPVGVFVRTLAPRPLPALRLPQGKGSASYPRVVR